MESEFFHAHNRVKREEERILFDHSYLRYFLSLLCFFNISSMIHFNNKSILIHYFSLYSIPLNSTIFSLLFFHSITKTLFQLRKKREKTAEKGPKNGHF